MSLPPSATPRSVPPRDEPTYMNTTTENRFHHRPSVASKKSMVDLGPSSAVTSYHLSSVEPATPITPQTHDSSRVQPSLQFSFHHEYSNCILENSFSFSL